MTHTHAGTNVSEVNMRWNGWIRWNRQTPLALTWACLLAFAPTSGLRPAFAEKAGRDSKSKPAETVPAKGLRVAVLPVVNRSSEVDAVKIMEDVLTERFKDVDRARATFFMPADVERILSSQDALARAYRIGDRWAKDGTLDSTAIGGLDSILVADAVLCIKIGEWETKRFHNIGEGQSNSTVALHFALFGIREMKLLWSKDIREQRLAPEMDISSGTVGYDATGRIQSHNVNEPPRTQDVASDLVRDALKKFPIK